MHPTLIDKLRDALRRERFRRWISLQLADELIDGIAEEATLFTGALTVHRISRDRRRLPAVRLAAGSNRR